MRRLTTIPLAVVLLVLAVDTAWAQRRTLPPGARPVPYITGVWYMNGDPNLPCEIRQRDDGREAMFINEHGSETMGVVRPDHVWIPDWGDGRSQGLMGRIRGTRIVWPNGTFWSR